MCRFVVFIGSCTFCGALLDWSDLTQELPCLESKNAGQLGACRQGVLREEHVIDQECDACAQDELTAEQQQQHHQHDQKQPDWAMEADFPTGQDVYRGGDEEEVEHKVHPKTSSPSFSSSSKAKGKSKDRGPDNDERSIRKKRQKKT